MAPSTDDDLSTGDDLTAGDEQPRLLAVMLAAGGGTRWVAAGGEGHKLTATMIDGFTVIRRSVAAPLLAGLEVVVVTGAVDLRGALPEIPVVHNDRWSEGQATSLQVAVQYATERGFNAMLVGLGDQPWVRHELWECVASRLSWPGAPIVIPTVEGQRGQPVGLRASVWGLLPTDGDEGARVVMRNNPELVEEVSCSLQNVASDHPPLFDGPQLFDDIDTPKDLPWN
jgi:molybdenum cofactor cytidylyltransferase